MSRGWIMVAVLAAGCADRARADYDRCVERDNAYDVPGAYTACAAAVAADPKSLSGQAAAKKLDSLQPVMDKLKVERSEKAERDLKIKKDEPPAPVVSAVATTYIPPVMVVPWDGGANGPFFAQAQVLYTNGDVAGARAVLEPRVLGATKGAVDEAKLLATICKAQKDKSCLMALAKKYR